jgi:pyruvate dehydrogenase E1 component alpha subunit
MDAAPDERLFYEMVRIRCFEEALGDLWQRGLISGELHLGIGEEAIAAGVVDHLTEGDALALDHRPTPELVAAGVSMTSMVLEMLGHPDGLGGGNGGHMHLFSRDHRAVSSGIVGSSGPTACGLALAQQLFEPGRVTVAFFGEGAMNQGMLLESLNLAVVWRLPVVFVCKDNQWSISTRSERVTAGKLTGRAAGFGLRVGRVDGSSVRAVWKAAGAAVRRARRGKGPSFLVASCYRPRGHFEDDPLVRQARHPSEAAREASDLLRSSFEPGSGRARARLGGMSAVTATLLRFSLDRLGRHRDPLRQAEPRLAGETADRLRASGRDEVAAAVRLALDATGVAS